MSEHMATWEEAKAARLNRFMSIYHIPMATTPTKGAWLHEWHDPTHGLLIILDVEGSPLLFKAETLKLDKRNWA